MGPAPTQTRRPFAERPLSWNRAKDAALQKTETTLALFARSEAQSRSYKSGRAKLLKEYASIPDAVKIRILNYNYILNKDSLKEATTRRHDSIVFTPNEFPYYFEPGIEHHVVWSEKELTNSEVEIVIKENREGYETVWFRNPPSFQTIPELWHVHVLSRPLPQDQHRSSRQRNESVARADLCSQTDCNDKNGHPES